MRPMTELVRGDRGVLHLTFYHLTPEQAASLRDVMWQNATGGIWELRAEAGAHLDRWSPSEGVVSMWLHGSEPEAFMEELGRLLRLPIDTTPRDEYEAA